MTDRECAKAKVDRYVLIIEELTARGMIREGATGDQLIIGVLIAALLAGVWE